MYKNTHCGNYNWSPVLMLKTLLLQRIYNASDRERQLKENKGKEKTCRTSLCRSKNESWIRKM